MRNVYIVTHGCYSDYSIAGVFDTRELAEEYIQLEKKKSKSRFNEYDVEEFTLNQVVPEPVYTAYLSTDYVNNKHVQNVRIFDKAEVLLNRVPSVEIAKTIYEQSNVLICVGTVYGETRELAEKNAWDAVAKAKAEFLNL